MQESTTVEAQETNIYLTAELLIIDIDANDTCEAAKRAEAATLRILAARGRRRSTLGTQCFSTVSAETLARC